MSHDTAQTGDLIDRYVYQVVRRLPQSQRADIEAELRGLIDDMLSARGGGKREDVIAVLRELGRPAELASRYSGSRRSLIGPEYYDTYLLVLKIVLAATGFGMAVAQAIGFAAEAPSSIFAAAASFFAAIFSAMVQAFAWVTIIFALIERWSKGSFIKDTEWDPDDLPPVPEKNTAIPRSEPIAGIVFIVLLLVLLNAAPQLFSAYLSEGGSLRMVPVFDLTVFYRHLPLVDAMICVGLVKEVLRLVTGRYTLALSLGLTALNIVSVVMFILLFGPASGVWNPDFMTQIGTEWSLSETAAKLWSFVPIVFTGFVILGHVIDSVQAILRGARHRAA
jgi:hypothetical protein